MHLPRFTKSIADLRRFARQHWKRALQVREKLRFSEEAFHLLLAGGVGVLGGLVNVASYYILESVKALFLRAPGDPVEVAEMLVAWQRVAVPTVGGLIAGLVLYWGLRLAGPQGSSNLLEVVVAGDGRLPFRSALVKFISSMMTIGSGGSIGREGAITQFSATLASKCGQFARWHPYRLRLLVGCGAASGISAAYNAPISGAVFAGLIVLGNFSMGMFAPLVFASVVATMVSRTFFGIRPWYTVPAFEFTSLTQLPWFVVLGLVAGALGAAFLKLLHHAEGLFQRLKAPVYVRVTLGGLVVGLLALAYPGVWGNGYIVTSRILHGEYAGVGIVPASIVDPRSLAARLQAPAPMDNLSGYLQSGLSPQARGLVSNNAAADPARLREVFAEELNRVIARGPLFDPQRFAGVNLSPETLAALEAQPVGDELTRVNRLLLAEAYPREIRFDSASWSPSYSLWFLLGLLLAKVLATAATVGSGAVGGVFTPTLFLGAGLGAVFGLGLQQLGAEARLPIAPFAAVGMGGMLAATTHSPLLAIIIVFEISLEYSLMPPLMLACVVATLVSKRLHPRSIYTEPLRTKELLLSDEANTSEAATQKTVADIMRAPVPPVRETATLRELADRFLTSANNFLPVVDARRRLLGVVALQDLKEYLNSDEPWFGIIAYDVMRPPPPSVTPNQKLIDVLPVILASEQRNVPVVNTLKENHLVGTLARAEVLAIFSEAIAASNKGQT